MLLWRRVSATSPEGEDVRGLSPKAMLAQGDTKPEPGVSVCELRMAIC